MSSIFAIFFRKDSAKSYGTIFSFNEHTVSVIALKGHSQLFHYVKRRIVSNHKFCLYSKYFHKTGMESLF